MWEKAVDHFSPPLFLYCFGLVEWMKWQLTLIEKEEDSFSLGSLPLILADRIGRLELGFQMFSHNGTW